MLLLGEGSEATEPYNKYDKLRPHSIRSLQFDQKVRPLSFRPEKFDLFTATPYVPILLSEVEQVQRPRENGDREAIVVEACLCDSEGERAFTIYDPVLGGKMYLKYFKRFAGAKTLQKRNNSVSKLSIHFRSRFSLTHKSDPKIPHQSVSP